MTRLLLPLFATLLALAPVSAQEAAPAAAKPTGDKPAAYAITGHVKWTDAKPPRRRKLRMDSDPVCVDLCRGERMLDERAIVDGDGNFQNVVIHISKGLPEQAWPVPTEEVVVDQVACRYVPHIVAFQLGQKMRIKSSDPTPHNVHFVSKNNGSWNVNMTRPGEIAPKVPFKAPEFERPTALFKCDIHPWMEARLFIFDHPFHAVTDEKGRFQIPLGELAPGKYTLTAIHEKYRSASVEIEVKKGSGAEVNFTFNKKKENAGTQVQ